MDQISSRRPSTDEVRTARRRCTGLPRWTINPLCAVLPRMNTGSLLCTGPRTTVTRPLMAPRMGLRTGLRMVPRMVPRTGPRTGLPMGLRMVPRTGPRMGISRGRRMMTCTVMWLPTPTTFSTSSLSITSPSQGYLFFSGTITDL